jgi:uncharacterized membrane protein
MDSDHSEGHGYSTSWHRPVLVELMQRLEGLQGLDRLGGVVGPVSSLLRGRTADYWLRGGPTGHALHPALTDLPIGFWTSTFVLDGLELFGRRERGMKEASDLLLDIGIATALPAAATGLSEWRRLGRREARVGSLHAVLNSLGLVLYVLSTLSRRRGARPAGLALAFAGATSATAAGYLGGHLAAVRHAASRHPAFLSEHAGRRSSSR